MCSIGEVFKAALPSGLNLKNKEKKQAKESQIEFQEETSYHLTPSESPQYNLKPLNTYQQDALREIEQSFEEKDVSLLHGVTSSGKTEIYIHLINKYMREGKQVLYLLPEIALTTQITERLKNVFGNNVGVYHSKFTDKERADVYQSQLSDHPYGLILGVRSSIFLPFSNLGLIIVDEEHEMSYKQQNPAPRYHARNSAIMLAKLCGAKTLLGTATPSLEVYKMAENKKYGYIALTHRYRDLQLPDIEVVDTLRLSKQKRMKGSFSEQLLNAISVALNNGEQVILFQNRRGYSSFMQCKNCGWVPHCDRCDVSLTYHRRITNSHTPEFNSSRIQEFKSSNLTPPTHSSLSCHYCGRHFLLPNNCPNCGEKDFMFVGLGTEKIEDQIKKLFPDAQVIRMDLDTAKSRTSYEEIINGFSSHKYDILVGTQMVSKGLDFDNVSVVGVLDADCMLNLPDFRSYERTYQVLSQVAGRAGRKHHKGKVIIQTRSADLPLISYVVSNSYDTMFLTQMAERKIFTYPPFCRLIYVYLKHHDPSRVEQCAEQMIQDLRKLFGERVLGPDRPPIARMKSQSLRKIVVKLKNNDSPTKIKEVLTKVRNNLMAQPYSNGLTIFFDVDPV